MPRLEDQYRTLSSEQYFELVENYVPRQLSYPSDALNAFSGILSALTNCSGERFTWGLMKSNFERQLYWTGQAHLRTGVQENEFPSWSWTAWQGLVSFNHYRYYTSLVECWTMCEDVDGRKLVKVSDSNAVVSQEADLSPPIKMEDIAQTHMLNTIQPEFHLFFYTYSATFYLVPQGRLILPRLKPRFDFDSHGRVVGPKPDYGYLIPSLDESELCDQGYRECILLGRKAPASDYDVAHVVVMLVSRTNGICHRLAIADMPEEFWNLAEKTHQLVILG